jgi:saxitoxin biosynthesis operon SxtJ-like protein
MQWSSVIAPPKPTLLRQFAGLFLIVFVGLALWRAWHGQFDLTAKVMAAAGLGVGVVGLVWPAAVRWIYTGWMVVAFPIGWTVSHLMLAVLFYLIFTPVAFVFRAMGRDVLRLRRGTSASYWTPKAIPASSEDYFAQS